MSNPSRRLRIIRSERSTLNSERRWLVWNHGNWTKADRLMRRAERRALNASVAGEDE